MATKYQKFGLRADKNLVDLEDNDQALANLLEGLTVDDNFPFTPPDLKVIVGLRNTDVTPDDIIEAGDDSTRVTYTPIDDPNSIEDVQPLVRIVDRIENYRVITGTPNFINGGDGPNAWIFPGTQLGSNISASSTGADVLPNRNSDDVIGPIDFWDNGVFSFGIKIDDTFPDTYGGAQWEGYTGLNRFTIQSSGLYMIEYDPYGDGYEMVRNIYDEDRDITYTTSGVTEGRTFITVNEDQVKYINVGDFVTEGLLKVKVDSVDQDVSPVVVTFDGEVSGLSATGGTMTLSFEMSGEETIFSPEINLRTTFTGDMHKIRITAWWKNRGDNDRLPNKLFEFYDTDSERYPFSYFYKEYDRNATLVPYTYEYFDKFKASPTSQVSDVALESDQTISMPAGMNLVFM